MLNMLNVTLFYMWGMGGSLDVRAHLHQSCSSFEGLQKAAQRPGVNRAPAYA
jgi:hypothetical protein